MKHVLTLTNDAICVARCQGLRVLERLEFALSVPGTMAFEAWLKANSQVVTYLLLDLAELEFRLDTMAHLSGRDRDAVLARKLAQTFRATPYRHARIEGREAGGRRDDRVLLSAVSNADVLRPWLELLRLHAIPVAGCVASPLVSGSVLAGLLPTSTHTMLVTVPAGGGLRQTYFRGGELRFSRLTRLAANETTDLAALVASEVARTWQYLEGQRAFGLDDTLDVAVLVPPKDALTLTQSLTPTEQIAFTCVGVDAAAAKLGVKLPAGCDAADALIAAQVARTSPHNQFASTDDRQSHVVRQARIGLLAMAATVLAGGVGWAAHTAFKARDTEDRALWRAVQTRSLQDQTNALQSARGGAGVASATMRDTVIFYQRYLARPALLSDFLVPLSSVLTRMPEVRLLRVAWQPAEGEKLTPAQDPGGRAPVNNPVEAAREAATFAQRAGEPQAYGPRAAHLALLEADVRLGSLDTRGAAAVAEAMAAQISALPGYQAKVERYPLDTASVQRIEGKLGREPTLYAHRFVLAVSHTPAIGASHATGASAPRGVQR